MHQKTKFPAIDVEALLAFHRAQFGDARMEATGDNGGDDGAGNGGSEGGDGGQQQASGEGGEAGGDDDKGFPADTPTAKMTPEQALAYWKDKARKHENRAKALDTENATLKVKADRADELERDLMSDQEKAVEDAKKTARAEGRNELLPELVKAKIAAAAAGTVSAERLEKATKRLDLKGFIGEDGTVNADEVKEFVESLGTDTDSGRRGPSGAGLGPHNSKVSPSIASGQDAYAKRHPSKATA